MPAANLSSEKNGEVQKSLSYDLGFIEFQEDGKPYALRKEVRRHGKVRSRTVYTSAPPGEGAT